MPDLKVKQPKSLVAIVEERLRDAIVEGMGVKPRFAFTPLRVALTGRRVSPPLFESMELLGKPRSLDRLDRAATLPG